MNKRIIRIIAVALTINILSLVQPTKYLIMTTEAYASTDNVSVYLKTLSLNKSDIDFLQDTFFYNVKVDKDVNEIKLTAKPKSTDATIKINDEFVDELVDENGNYRKTISLDQGNNIVKIELTNDDGERNIYTLNITRGEALQDNIYLNNITLDTGNINFSKETSSYDVNVKESVDKITIGAIPEEDMHVVTIDGAHANKSDGYKQTVNLNKGMNPIVIKVENKDNDQRTYILNINRENSLDTNEKQDDIYLYAIKCSDGVTNINKNSTTYELNLNENVEETYITAQPESGKYTVKINDKMVEDVDDNKEKLTLKPGRNVITIKVQDQSTNKQRTYTLYLNRGPVTETTNTAGTQIAGSNTSNTTSTINNVVSKCNQWIQVSGKWQYNDSTGNPLKNKWYYDRSYGKMYYLQVDGNMATNWLDNGGNWYCLGQDGGMKTGWQNVEGKWYYLDSNGVMAKNTTINGFKLGNDGAWVK